MMIELWLAAALLAIVVLVWAALKSQNGNGSMLGFVIVVTALKYWWAILVAIAVAAFAAGRCLK